MFDSIVPIRVFLYMLIFIAIPIYGLLGLRDYWIWRSALRLLAARSIPRHIVRNLRKNLSKMQYRRSAHRIYGLLFRAYLFRITEDEFVFLDIRRPGVGRRAILSTQELIVFKSLPAKRRLIVTNMTGRSTQHISQHRRAIGWPRCPTDSSLKVIAVVNVGNETWTVYADPVQFENFSIPLELAELFESFTENLPVWAEVSELGIVVATSLNIPKMRLYSPFRISKERIRMKILLASQLAIGLAKVAQ